MAVTMRNHENLMLQIGRHKILTFDTSGVAHRERSAKHRSLNRAPYIKLGEAALNPLLGLGGIQRFAHHLRSGLGCIVVVNRRHRFANSGLSPSGSGRASHVVREHYCFRGTGDPLDQRLHLRVIHRTHSIGIIEVRHGGRLSQQNKPLYIQGEPIGDRPRIVNRRSVECGPPGPVGRAGIRWRTRDLIRADQIKQRSLDMVEVF